MKTSFIRKYLILPGILLSVSALLAQNTYRPSLKFNPGDEERKKALSDFYEGLANLNPDSVTAIVMTNLQADSLPDFSRFYRLKSLDLSGNKFKVLHKKLIPCNSLEYLNISQNPWKRIKLCKSSTIKTLIIGNSELEKIPRQIRKLTKLKHLRVPNNELTKIPGFIARMDSLRELALNHNTITLNSKTLRAMRNINKILLIANKLTELPENIDLLKSVERLNLAQNELGSLPESFGNLDSLKSVIFYKNRFDTIPSVLFRLTNLIELDFYYNNLTEIPQEIEQLANLELLYLAFNSIKAVPATIRELKQLKKLYLHHNDILKIDPWLPLMPSLKVLDIGFNKIVEFPAINGTSHLHEVDVQNNLMQEIPWDLLMLPSLKVIYLRDNPFVFDETSAYRFKKIVETREKQGVRIYFN